jgi:hypothetical protein
MLITLNPRYKIQVPNPRGNEPFYIFSINERNYSYTVTTDKKRAKQFKLAKGQEICIALRARTNSSDYRLV